jgi:hypothetical protein
MSRVETWARDDRCTSPSDYNPTAICFLGVKLTKHEAGKTRRMPACALPDKLCPDSWFLAGSKNLMRLPNQ